MHFEIERRFLLKNKHWKRYIINQVLIVQGYLSSNNDEWIVRLRSENKQFKLALKKHIIQSTSLEFEYEINSKEGNQILSNIKNKIEKERFYLKINAHNWIVDIFQDRNAPLEIAEIELESEQEILSIPDFIDKEITGIKIFSNHQLSINPFSSWSDKDVNKFS